MPPAAPSSAPVLEQTPAQWAVRWFAVVAVGLLVSSVPLLHLAWRLCGGGSEPPIRTASQVKAGPITWQRLLDHSWMAEVERELREAAPLTFHLRGAWQELRYRCRVPQSRQVHFGADDWFFIATSVHPDNAAFECATAARRRFLGEVRDLVRTAGAELLMAVVPDKARVYPDKVYPGGDLPPDKAGNYARILAEFEVLGIAAVDLATPLREARRVHGDDEVGELYFRRDTHWRPAGALVGGRAIAAAIEHCCGDRLAPRREARLSGVTVTRAVGDLTMMLGIRAAILPDPAIGQRPVALSMLADQLAEQRSYYGVELQTDRGFAAMTGGDPQAQVLLIGTSFSEENGMNALALALGRPVRGVIRRGAQGMLPLLAAVEELRGGARYELVVWELVERGMFEGAWLDPRLPSLP